MTRGCKFKLLAEAETRIQSNIPRVALIKGFNFKLSKHKQHWYIWYTKVHLSMSVHISNNNNNSKYCIYN